MDIGRTVGTTWLCGIGVAVLAMFIYVTWPGPWRVYDRLVRMITDRPTERVKHARAQRGTDNIN